MKNFNLVQKYTVVVTAKNEAGAETVETFIYYVRGSEDNNDDQAPTITASIASGNTVTAGKTVTVTAKDNKALSSVKYRWDSTTNYTSVSNVNGTVTLAGSTSVAPVMNVLADKYKELNPNVKVEIQESGSSAGIESAIQGAVDIAMSSRELKDDEMKTLKSETIALDGIAVIVNSENSIANFTSQQIKSIYLGEITDWENVK